MLALIALAWGAPVVAASHDVPMGTVLTADDVYVAELPAELLPAEVVTDVASVVGWTVREPLLKNDLVRRERLVQGHGLQALVPRGMRLVQVPLAHPVPHVRVGDFVDVARGDRGCLVGEALTVLGVADDHLKVAVAQEHAEDFVDLETARVFLRGRLDVDTAEVASCHRPPEAVVVHRDDAAVLQPPSAKAQAMPLLRGNNAYIGELWLDPGGKVPVHRDPTEEYLVVLEGSGTLTVDGKDYTIRPGSAVYMPAHAEVTYVNGDARLHVLQVFAGPGPAKKYDAWKAR